MTRTLLALVVAAVLLAATPLLPDGWIYSGTTLLALFIWAVIRRFHAQAWKVTRWAKEHPRKTQALLTVIQVIILALGLLVGYDLKELGYQVGTGPAIIFGTILTTGFLSIRFLPKRSPLALPALVNRDRIAYMGIALSAYVLMVVTGNRIEDKYPGSVLSIALKSADHILFSQEPLVEDKGSAMEVSYELAKLTGKRSSLLSFASLGVPAEKIAVSLPAEKVDREKIKAGKKAEKLEKKKQKLVKRLERMRKAFAVMSTVATVLLVILLIITTCAGVCLILIGGSAGAIILGVVLTAASIWGFTRLSKKKKRAKAG